MLHIVKSAQGRRGKSPLGLTCPDTTQHFELFLKVPEEVGSLQLALWFGKRMLKTAGWGDFHRGGTISILGQRVFFSFCCWKYREGEIAG